MAEEIFTGSFEQYCKANPREDFETLRPRYEAIQAENRRQNALMRHERMRGLEAEKAARQREREEEGKQAEREREANAKRMLRAQYATLTEEQYERMWPRIYDEHLLLEANKQSANFRRQYQF